MNCGIVHRCSSDLALLWCRPADVALIRLLAWELPYAAGAALKSKQANKQTNKKTHKRIKNQNHNGLSEWLPSNRPQITNVGEDVKKRELLHTLGGNVDWCSHCGKQSGCSSKN